MDGILIPGPDNRLPIFYRVPDTDKHKWIPRPGTRRWGWDGWASQKEPQSHTPPSSRKVSWDGEAQASVTITLFP